MLFCALLSADFSVRTVFAAVEVVGGTEGLLWVVDFFEQALQMLVEFALVCTDVGDGRTADDERGVVVVAGCVLDENEGGRDGCRAPFDSPNWGKALWRIVENGGVEQGLEVIVGVLFRDVGRVENFLHRGDRLGGFSAGFVVDDTNNWSLTPNPSPIGEGRIRFLRVSDAVEAVDDAFDGDFLAVYGEILRDFPFHINDGEGSEFLVDFQKFLQIVDDDLPIDDLQTV